MAGNEQLNTDIQSRILQSLETMQSDITALRAQQTASTTEMTNQFHSEIAALRTSSRTDIANLRTSVGAAMRGLHSRISEDIRANMMRYGCQCEGSQLRRELEAGLNLSNEDHDQPHAQQPDASEYWPEESESEHGDVTFGSAGTSSDTQIEKGLEIGTLAISGCPCAKYRDPAIPESNLKVL
jgi:hypothetical protein